MAVNNASSFSRHAYLLTLLQISLSAVVAFSQTSSRNGTVHVKLHYPSDYVPEMEVYLKEIHTNTYHVMSNRTYNDRVVFKDIPAGDYVAYAYEVEGASSPPNTGGAYTYFILCDKNREIPPAGMTPSRSYCDNHNLIVFTVKPGGVIKGIRLYDWYGAKIPSFYENKVNASTMVCDNFSQSIYNKISKKLALREQYDFYFNRALQYIQQSGEHSYDAVAYLNKAIEMRPDIGATYSDLGNCYRGGFKCYDKAELCYTTAIERGFAESFVYYNRAICRYELNNMSGMRSDLQRAQQLGWTNDYYGLGNK
jgi:tetratricopeptide (TPR) repeat protein